MPNQGNTYLSFSDRFSNTNRHLNTLLLACFLLSIVPATRSQELGDLNEQVEMWFEKNDPQNDVAPDMEISPFSCAYFDGVQMLVDFGEDHVPGFREVMAVETIGWDLIIEFAYSEYGDSTCHHNAPCWQYQLMNNFNKVFYEIAGYPLESSAYIEYIWEDAL